MVSSAALLLKDPLIADPEGSATLGEEGDKVGKTSPLSVAPLPALLKDKTVFSLRTRTTSIPTTGP